MLTNFTVIQRRLRRLAELRVMQGRGDFERMSGKEANDAKDDLVVACFDRLWPLHVKAAGDGETSSPQTP